MQPPRPEYDHILTSHLMVVTSVPQMDFLLRLMEMYVTIGLEVKRNLQADREPANRVKSKGWTMLI